MALNRGDILRSHQTALVRITVTGRNVDGRLVPQRTGVGIVVGPNGLIVTAAHVVGKTEDWAETDPGSRLPDRIVSVVGLDEQGVDRSLGNASVWPVPGYDLALLYVRAQALRAPSLADQEPPDDADLVALLWGAQGVPEPIPAAVVPTDRARFPRLFTVHLRVVEGNSGSGLFDAQSHLVGIILNRLVDQDRALAVPIALIKPHLPLPPDGGLEPKPGDDMPPERANEIEKLKHRLSLVKRDIAWIETCQTRGWYELLEIRKELDEFGDVVQCHRLSRIHGPETGRIDTVPLKFRAEPKFGTCVLKKIFDEQKQWSRPDLPPAATTVDDELRLSPPATTQQIHAGFNVSSTLINSFVMTVREAEQRGHPPVENTAVGAAYPARHLRLALFFPAGYQPEEIRVVAFPTSDIELPWEKRREDSAETERISLFFDRKRGCAILTVERYSPEYHYMLSWRLPPLPEPPWAEAEQAREQVRALLDLGERGREAAEAELSSIRDKICETSFRSNRRSRSKVHLSLLAFDEDRGVTRILLTTADGDARRAAFPRGAGVVGWVMRRRRPAFVDTRDAKQAGIYLKVDGMPQERHLLCVPLPLPSNSEHGAELMLNPAMPCLVAALGCADDSVMGRLTREEHLEAVSSNVATRLLDLLSRVPLS